MFQTSMFFSADLSAEIVQKLLRGSATAQSGQLKTIPRLRFANGQSMSVQASEFHRCSPRSQRGPYTHVEVGYPSEPFPQLMGYIQIEEGISPCKSVYNFVPIEVVMDIIVENGGLLL